ncbi:MAG TPA: 16S rRNA (uracil(1498)-N(3))-methyltransferase [Kiritimatiellia bacterium]|nr:16S rRNA (uracil(1498)-N(3))-methyltransferase [Kiritimatiellia bacterium]HMP35643.1 16S rRNA (uracil(1498)-N(3))-methyltransferase [Kiritimatiellia bacterium]
MRYFVDAERWSAEDVILSGEEAHHLLHVVRSEPGEQVTLMDGRGRQALARIAATTRKEAQLTILQQSNHPPPPVEITLIQALPREQKMDLILQKATELGVRHIVPVVSDQAVVRLKAGEDAGKRERWNKIVLSAAKQSGCWWMPEVHPVRPLLDYLAAMPRFDLLMTCSLDPDSLPLRQVIASSRAHRPRRVAFLVGPEGDLTARERAAARNAGARMVSLGDQVLRSETAALYVISVLQYEFTGAGLEAGTVRNPESV